MLMNLSPRDLAGVIGVSESSLKRWVDDGRLVASRTAGGHRRITIQEAVRFLRRSASEVRHPELLGIADLTVDAVDAVATGRGEASLLAALRRGDASMVHGIILAALLRSPTVGPVFDGPIAYAWNRLSDELRAGGDGKLIGQRAAGLLIDAIEHVQRLLIHTEPAGSRAMIVVRPGANNVMERMVWASLKECGFAIDAVDEQESRGSVLGIERSGPALVCVVADGGSGIDDVVGAGLGRVVPNGSRTVVCGRGVLAARSRYPGVWVAESMCELQSAARATLAEWSQSAKPSEPVTRARSARAM